MATRYVTGGDKLTARLNEIARGLKKGATLSVGVLEGATYPNGMSVATVAAIQEFGAPSRGIPPRPFMRNTVAAHENEWPDAIAQNLLANDYDAEKALGQVGEIIEAEIKQSIIDTTAPPLSPITVMLRGMKANNPSLVITGKTVGQAAARVKAGKTNYGASTKPLVASGHLLQSIASKVDPSS